MKENNLDKEEKEEVLTFDDLADGEIFELEEDIDRVLLKINNPATYCYDKTSENTVDVDTGEMIYISKDTKVILIKGYLSVHVH